MEKQKENPDQKSDDDSNLQNSSEHSDNLDLEAEESEKHESQENLNKKVKDAYEKNEDFQEKYIRVRADLENFKRRQIKEREDAVTRTRSQIISDLLPALDAFQMGLAEVEKDDSTKNIFIGISMAYKQMETVLGEYGLEIIKPDGEIFDPKFHEALSYQKHEEIAEGVILQTVRFGYKIREKLLRPASVIISQGKEKEDN